jgi:hypothetical protein
MPSFMRGSRRDTARSLLLLGTMLWREPASEEKYEELRVRALTGLGAEVAEERRPAKV